MSYPGLVPAMELAEACDLHGIVSEHVRIDGHKGVNPGGKVATLVAGMLAGADSIDDTDDLRSGGMTSLFARIYAPSTVGEFLRAFHHGNVRQLQTAAREFLVQLAGRGRLLPGADAVAFLDVDSLLRRVYGKQKQGARFGHAKVGGYQLLLRGLNPLIATLSTPDAAPIIVATQLRAGNAGSARGASSLLAEAITTAKAVLAAQHRRGTGGSSTRYLVRFPDERDRVAPLLAELDCGSAITDRSNRTGHLTCSAALIDPEARVLLIHHNALGRWLRPGGHLEPQDTTLPQAALRELCEETGIPASLVTAIDEITPLDIDAHVIPANPARGEPEHWHFDLCYAFRVADRPEVALQAAEVSGYQWSPVSELQPVAYRRKVVPIVATDLHPGE